MTFSTFVQNKLKFFKDLEPVFGNLISMTVKDCPDFINKDTLQNYLSRNLSEIGFITVEFPTTEIHTFNDYKIINVNPFINSSGEFTITLVDDLNYSVSKFFKTILHHYHQGLNLKRNLPLKDLTLVLNIYKHTKESKSFEPVMRFEFYSCVVTNVEQSWTPEYGNHELLTVTVTISYKYISLI